MSGPLLLGILGVGAGWMYLTRDVKLASVPDTASPGASKAAAADSATVAEVSDHGTCGMAAVIADADTGGKSTTIGESPVAGQQGDGQIIPKKMDIVEGNIVIGDDTKSPGGADPSVQRTAIFKSDPDETPPFLPGDASVVLIQAKYGTTDGLVKSQINDAYASSAAFSSEVW